MEAFKIDLFEREYSRPFPLYRSLPLTEGQALQARIASRFGLKAFSTATEFASVLAARQTYYDETNAADNFYLWPLLTALGINPLPELFINWGRFEEVDAMQTADVAHYFHDFWYPTADDIDLCDASVNWVVSIRHDGVVSFIR
jgi:hypothetical protein